MKQIHEIVKQQLLKSPRRHGDIPLTLLPSIIDPKRPRWQDVHPQLTYAQLPEEVSLAGQMTAVTTFDQGNWGTCQNCCWVRYMKALMAILDVYYPTDGQGFSVRFDYEVMKANQPAADASQPGGSILEALTVGQQYGVVPESLYPYSGMTTDVNNSMPPASIVSQAGHRLGAVHPILSETDTDRSSLIPALMNAIYYQKGLLFGVIVCPNFISPTLQPDGSYLIPLPQGAIEGAHAIFVDKYTKTSSGSALFSGEIWNSWGPNWPTEDYQGRASLDPAWLDATYQPADIMAYYLMEAWTADDNGTLIVMTIGNTEALVNDATITLDKPPVIDPASSRTLVPIRFVSEQLGATVNWNATTLVITITWGSNTLTLTIGSSIAYLNGAPVGFDQPPYIDPATGRTMVPVRFIAESMAANVTWIPATQEVVIVI
jgi:hypothetical protein